MDKPKELISNEDRSENQRSPAASPPPPTVPTVVPGTTATTGDETPVAHQDEEEAEYLGPKALYILISSLMLVVIVLTLDQSILATAIPYVTNEFHTIADIGWYASAYLLSTAALQVSKVPFRGSRDHSLTISLTATDRQGVHILPAETVLPRILGRVRTWFNDLRSGQIFRHARGWPSSCWYGWFGTH
jgi:hypothetical protein